MSPCEIDLSPRPSKNSSKSCWRTFQIPKSYGSTRTTKNHLPLAPPRSLSPQLSNSTWENFREGRVTSSTMGTRPRVEKQGSHGLFSYAGEPISLGKVAQEVDAHRGNIWTAIYSLRREDAQRLGFDTAARWRDLLRSQAVTLAEGLKIPPTHLKWYAAFHNEGHHPHVHLIAYSSKPSEGFLTKQGMEKIRSALAQEIFPPGFGQCVSAADRPSG